MDETKLFNLGNDTQTLRDQVKRLKKEITPNLKQYTFMEVRLLSLIDCLVEHVNDIRMACYQKESAPKKENDPHIPSPPHGLQDFGVALSFVKQGYGICRKGWLEKDQWVGLTHPICDLQNEFLYIKIAAGVRCVWIPSMEDILANDWYVMNIQFASK